MALTFLDFLCQPHTDLTCPLIFCMSFRHELHNILGESNWDIVQQKCSTGNTFGDTGA